MDDRGRGRGRPGQGQGTWTTAEEREEEGEKGDQVDELSEPTEDVGPVFGELQQVPRQLLNDPSLPQSPVGDCEGWRGGTTSLSGCLLPSSTRGVEASPSVSDP